MPENTVQSQEIRDRELRDRILRRLGRTVAGRPDCPPAIADRIRRAIIREETLRAHETDTLT